MQKSFENTDLLNYAYLSHAETFHHKIYFKKSVINTDLQAKSFKYQKLLNLRYQIFKNSNFRSQIFITENKYCQLFSLKWQAHFICFQETIGKRSSVKN